MKPPRFVVGLTGGIGTGKSTALAEFERLGAATVSLDQIAREQAKPGREGYKAIVRDFGTCILKSDKTIDRALLGRVVFNDKRARLGLEKITHPPILREMKRLVKKLNGVVVVDVPLLFEKKLEKNFDAIILVSCRTEQQFRRIVNRDGLDPEEARQRMKAQMPLTAKRKKADVTVENVSTVRHLKKSIREYYAGLTLLYGGR